MPILWAVATYSLMYTNIATCICCSRYRLLQLGRYYNIQFYSISDTALLERSYIFLSFLSRNNMGYPGTSLHSRDVYPLKPYVFLFFLSRDNMGYPGTSLHSSDLYPLKSYVFLSFLSWDTMGYPGTSLHSRDV